MEALPPGRCLKSAAPVSLAKAQVQQKGDGPQQHSVCRRESRPLCDRKEKPSRKQYVEEWQAQVPQIGEKWYFMDVRNSANPKQGK